MDSQSRRQIQDSVETAKQHKSCKRKVVEQAQQNLEDPSTEQVGKEDQEKQSGEDEEGIVTSPKTPGHP